MNRSRVLFLCLFLFSRVVLFSIENNEFDFSAENIDASRLKTVEVILPDTRSKGGEIREEHYIIKIADDGIIRSIILAIGNDNSRFMNIFRKNNLLNILSYEQKPLINNIKWDNNIYVKGSAGTYYSKDDSFTIINVNPRTNVIYEELSIELIKTSNDSLKEINQKGGMAVAYSNNVTEVTFSDYLDSKIVYKFIPEDIIGIYYGGIEGRDEYHPPIRIIKDSNTMLYSKNYIINTLNYLILGGCSVFTELRNVLFPLLFLENPFTRNNWGYGATSFLKERNAEYGPANLSSLGGLPWASANGYGIGDKISINVEASPDDSLIIVNGYVSKDRPELFAANSRVKQIKITNLNNGKNKICTIDDTMKPQNIGIRDLNPNQNTRLEIEILSVYPGARFNDLCIQAIF